MRPLGLALLTACTTHFDVDATTVRTQDVHVDLGQTACSGMVVDGSTVIRFSLSTDQQTCTMHVALAGSFLSVSELEQSYRDEIDGYPDDSTVAITAMRADIDRLRFVDPHGAPLANPVVVRWDASLALGGAPIAERAGSDSDSLFRGIRDLDLDAAVGPLNDAVAADGVLDTSGTVEVAMETSSLVRLLPAALELRVVVTLELHVSKTAASEL